MSQFSIGALSKATNCSVETIRYYEKIGLLPEAERTSGNQRRYDQSHYKRLLFILHARDLGFSIVAIRQLCALSAHPNSPCGEADAIAQKQLVAVRARIERLKLLEKELEKMTSCSHGHKVQDCQVIEALAQCGACHSEHHDNE